MKHLRVPPSLVVPALALLALAPLAPGPRAQAGAIGAGQPVLDLVPTIGTTPDRWSPPIRWRQPDGWYSTAAHATLLPDGRLLLIGYDRSTPGPSANPDNRRSAFLMTPTPLGQPLPSEVVVTSLTQPVDADFFLAPPYVVVDDLFCTGHALTADGALFTAGGTRGVYDFTDGSTQVLGLSYATRFDPASDAWTRLPADMLVVANIGSPARWYPAVTRLPDGRMLVTSGYDYVMPQQALNLSAEAYDPSTGSWEVLSPFGGPPFEIFNGDYTHPVVLPTPVGIYDLMMFGDDGVPVLMSTTDAPTWAVMPFPRPGTLAGTSPNYGASSALLPLRVQDGEWGYSNGSTLVVGGTAGSTHQRHADVYDPLAFGWLPRVPIGVPRHHPTSVLLPDGRVLVVGGHNMASDPELKRATYVDPADGFSVAYGSSTTRELRGYHNVALLLPDGRVLVGGGQDAVTGDKPEKTTFRYLYPSYMFRPRPQVLGAPATIQLGQSFALATAGAAPAEVVLMGVGSMTHSFDFNQRAIELEIESVVTAGGQSHLVTVGAPSDAQAAPPGHYMLFVLDAARTPSVASVVRVL